MEKEEEQISTHEMPPSIFLGTSKSERNLAFEEAESSFISCHFNNDLQNRVKETNGNVSAIDKESQSEAANKNKGSWNKVTFMQIVTMIMSGMLHAFFGVEVCLPGIIIPQLTNSTSDVIMTQSEIALFGSSICFGAAFGSAISGYLINHLGQKQTLVFTIPALLSAYVFTYFSYSVHLILAIRFVVGIMMGILATANSVHIAECVHKSVRGRLLAATDLFLQLGMLFVSVIGSTNLSWRNVYFICGLVTLPLPFIGYSLLPNSPRWLASKGKMKESFKSLTSFRKKSHSVQIEFDGIRAEMERNVKEVTTTYQQLKELFRMPVLKYFILLSFLMSAVQFTGPFSVFSYAVTIFYSADVEINEYFSVIVLAVIRFISFIVYLSLVDKLGRKPLFCWPLFLSGISLLALATFFYLKSVLNDVSHLFFIPLLSLASFTIFSSAYTATVMISRGELLPTRVRGLGVGILFVLFFLSGFLVALTFPYLISSVGSHGVFCMYAVVCFVTCGVSAMWLPETQGKSLEEVELMLKNSM